jgi:hypothetical protein
VLKKAFSPVIYVILALAILITLFCTAAPALAAGSTTSIRIIKYADDGITVLADKTVTYDWMEKMLPVLGDGKIHYYHQGPIFEGELWDPTETQNLKDKGAVKGTAVKDLCDLVGGMSPGDEISLVAVDKYHEEFGYDNIYQPAANQGTIAVCWYNGEDALIGEKYGEGYPGNNAFRTALQVVFMVNNKNSEGNYVFGNTDMKETMPQEKYQHFYEGEYPSTNGLSGKWIAELRIYTGGIKPGQQIDYTVKDYFGAAPAGTTDTGSSIPWVAIGLGAAGIILAGTSFFIFKNVTLLNVKRGSVLVIGVVLIIAAVITGVIGAQSTSSVESKWRVTVVGKGGTEKVMSIKDLKKLPSYTGRGGLFTTTGIVNGPWEGKGVLLSELAKLVGGMEQDDIIMVSAEDGYSSVFDYDQVSGDINTYSYENESIKETGHGELNIILMYQRDGSDLTEDDGKPLRIAVVGADNLLTEGNMWVKWVNRIEVLKIKTPAQ